MNILITSAHPAQVHNFLRIRTNLIKDGHHVYWATTPKDIATNLLDRYGIEYLLLQKAPKSFFGRVRAMVVNLWHLIPFMQRNHIDLVLDRYEPFTTIAARLLRVPHICLADTEHAAKICQPLMDMASVVLLPLCFWYPTRKDAIRFAGNIELFYTHNNEYTPPAPWQLLGIKPNTRYALVRFVKWDAYHDTKLVGGFSLAQKEELIQRISQHVRVFISSETALPASLEQYRVHVPIERMHDVQAHAALFVGESSTMASESVCLGTPAIYVDEIGRGYTDEEARAGLLWMYRPYPCQIKEQPTHWDVANAWKPIEPYKDSEGYEPWWISGGIEEAIKQAEYIVSPQFDQDAWQQRYQQWISTKIDPTAWLTWFIENYPTSAEECKKADFDWNQFK